MPPIAIELTAPDITPHRRSNTGTDFDPHLRQRQARARTCW